MFVVKKEASVTGSSLPPSPSSGSITVKSLVRVLSNYLLCIYVTLNVYRISVAVSETEVVFRHNQPSKYLKGNLTDSTKKMQRLLISINNSFQPVLRYTG